MKSSNNTRMNQLRQEPAALSLALSCSCPPWPERLRSAIRNGSRGNEVPSAFCFTQDYRNHHHIRAIQRTGTAHGQREPHGRPGFPLFSCAYSRLPRPPLPYKRGFFALNDCSFRTFFTINPPGLSIAAPKDFPRKPLSPFLEGSGELLPL